MSIHGVECHSFGSAVLIAIVLNMKGIAIFFFCVALAAATERFPSIAKVICSREGSDDTLVAHEHCNRFYICGSGRPLAMKCPPGLVYNIKKEWCDWPKNVICGLRPVVEVETEIDGNDTTWVPENQHDDPSQAPEICAAEDSEGVMVAHENCSQYYRCISSVPLTLDCGLGLFYSPALETCDWPSNVDCGNRNIAVNTA